MSSSSSTGSIPAINSYTSCTIPNNNGEASQPGAKKRKRVEELQKATELKPFTIRPCPTSIYDKPHTLTPLRLFDRAQLPLSFLDPTPGQTTLPPCRLFSAVIASLEPKHQEADVAIQSTKLLIAKLEASSFLYAVERVKSGIFALCKLCDWVKIGHLDDIFSAQSPPFARQSLAECHNGNSTEWWKMIAVDQESLVPDNSAKRPRLSMVPSALHTERVPVPTVTASIALDVTVSVPEVSLDAQEPEVSAQHVYETLVLQYLEALYKSKTSLAFFAKGPLSRARAAHTLGAQDDLTVVQLAAFLRGMLLTMTSMEKKYREKLPSMIKEFPHTSLSDMENEVPSSIKKRKSKKAPKLSKEGTYPTEEEHVRRWWISENPRRQDETAEEFMRRRIGFLRVRETLAQVIIILEILALEAAPNFKLAGDMGKDEDRTPIQIDPESKRRRKPKKPTDLVLLLDLLMDKLSIWQSIENDGPPDARKAADLASRDNDGKLQDRDLLARFCTEVVIPFYKSRVPEQAALVNKNLGGPVGLLTGSLKKPKHAAEEKGPRSGTDKRPRLPLHKTPSESYSQLKSRPRSLLRSNTDSQAIPRLKREASDVSIFDIPIARPAVRNSSVQLKHLQHRQIDLSAITLATEIKLKRKANIEEELKGAINTLKKPNRGEAVKEYMEASEQRSLGSASMRKKTAGPIRKILHSVQNVQVTATPKHVRKINALMPPGHFYVPASNIRPSHTDAHRGSHGHQTHIKELIFSEPAHIVAETPSHGTSRTIAFSDKTIQSHIPTSSPTNASHDLNTNTNFKASTNQTYTSSSTSASIPFKLPSLRNTTENIIPQTPSKPKSVAAKINTIVYATPQKCRVGMMGGAVADTPQQQRQQQQQQDFGRAQDCEAVLQRFESSGQVFVGVGVGAGAAVGVGDGDGDDGKSIYDALGWNDDDDIDELA